MLTLQRLEQLCAIARSKGAPDATPVRFAAGAGVAENVKIELNAAANIRAGHYLENPEAEVELEGTELVLNQ